MTLNEAEEAQMRLEYERLANDYATLHTLQEATDKRVAALKADLREQYQKTAHLEWQNATMLALLWRIPEIAGPNCPLCSTVDLQHAPDCPILAVMQWRAKEEASDGK